MLDGADLQSQRPDLLYVRGRFAKQKFDIIQVNSHSPSYFLSKNTYLKSCGCPCIFLTWLNACPCVCLFICLSVCWPVCTSVHRLQPCPCQSVQHTMFMFGVPILRVRLHHRWPVKTLCLYVAILDDSTLGPMFPRYIFKLLPVFVWLLGLIRDSCFVLVVFFLFFCWGGLF